MSPRFSIIIPFYNVEETIVCTLDSIFNQTEQDFEVILVDDKSTDNSVKIIEEYKTSDKCIKLIKSLENGGAGMARNLALMSAMGDYLLFLDADDRLINKSCLEKIQESLLRNPDVLVFKYYYSSEHFNKNREPKTECEVNIWNRIEHQIDYGLLSLEEILDTLLFPAYPWNKVYKRSIIEENNITFSETRCHNDLKFSWHALIAAKNISFLPEPIVLHDIDDDKPRITNNSSLNRLDLFQACVETEEILMQENVSDSILSYYQKFKWDAFNWGKFRIMRKGLWKFVYTYHIQLLKTPIRQRRIFINEHAISTREKIKFQSIVYFPIIYWFLLYRGLRKADQWI